MPWVFVQSAGVVYGPSGAIAFSGYSGNGADKDNPEAQFVKEHGPIPVGGYTIGAPIDGTSLGPCALPLTPDPTNVMQGRDGFFIHDDSLSHPGQASDGCLVTVGVSTRKTIWASPDHRLVVVAEDADRPQP